VLRETWSLGDVRDVEAFCGDVIKKFTRGERVAHKPGTDAFLSAADKDDLLAYLLAASWQAWLKFRPDDDGRGTNRFSGFLVWTLHRRVVDFLRLTKGSTRYPKGLVVTELVEYRPGLHDAVHYDDYEGLSDGREIDVEAMSVEGRAALALVRPLFDDEELTQGKLAARLGVPPGRVAKGVSLVRRELALQGLGADAVMSPH
jgi:DNA-directed RNA polymerase specialized sigma24 family protein